MALGMPAANTPRVPMRLTGAERGTRILMTIIEVIKLDRAGRAGQMATSQSGPFGGESHAFVLADRQRREGAAAPSLRYYIRGRMIGKQLR